MPLADGQHFQVSEFTCHDGTPYPEEWADRWAALIGLCDAIREAWGSPIEVVSGYRTPAHNAALIAADDALGVHGVASGSQHVEGRAADLRPATGGDAATLYRVVMGLFEAGKIPSLGGIGLYPKSNWVHVDTFKPDDGHLRRWLGT